MKSLYLLALSAVAARVASAQPAPAPAPAPAPQPTQAEAAGAAGDDKPAAPEPEPAAGAEAGAEAGEQPATAAEVATAPKPGQESGRLDPLDTGDGVMRLIGRGLLWIPRLPFELVIQPARGVVYLDGRYKVVNKITGVFFTEDKKLGIYPTALFETGFGLNVGARAIFKDLLGRDEKLKLRAGLGGQFRQLYTADFDTGTRLSKPFALGIDARYELRDKDHFYGYGNGDGPDTLPAMPIDPLTDDTAVRSEFRMTLAKVSPRVRFTLPHQLRLTLTGAYLHKKFGTGEAPASDKYPAIDLGYQVDRVPGFGEGTDFLYAETELAWDTRRAANDYDPPGMRSAGGLIMGFAARQISFDDNPGFFRAGVDLQRYFAIADGPRVLELRAYGEMVSGDRDRVPFTELPRLGGAMLLRGYDGDRFRDRLAAVGQASYLWALGRYAAGNLFVDVGRVYESFDAVTLKDMRVGFGAAVELYSDSGMLVRASLSSSIDGGLFTAISLDPVFDARARVERY